MRPTYSEERRTMIEQQKAESDEWLKTHRSSTCTKTPLTEEQRRVLRFKEQTEDRIARSRRKEPG